MQGKSDDFNLVDSLLKCFGKGLPETTRWHRVGWALPTKDEEAWSGLVGSAHPTRVLKRDIASKLSALFITIILLCSFSSLLPMSAAFAEGYEQQLESTGISELRDMVSSLGGEVKVGILSHGRVSVVDGMESHMKTFSADDNGESDGQGAYDILTEILGADSVYVAQTKDAVEGGLDFDEALAWLVDSKNCDVICCTMFLAKDGKWDSASMLSISDRLDDTMPRTG